VWLCFLGKARDAKSTPIFLKESLMYWRAVIDGITPTDSWGELSDPRGYFNKLEYKYLGKEHLKGVSSSGGRYPERRESEPSLQKSPVTTEKAAKLKGEILSRFVFCLCKQTGHLEKHRYSGPKSCELDCLIKLLL
jgi:hypothetical protein